MLSKHQLCFLDWFYRSSSVFHLKRKLMKISYLKNIGLIDIGGISKAFQIVKNGDRLQFAVYVRTRWTIWFRRDFLLVFNSIQRFVILSGVFVWVIHSLQQLNMQFFKLKHNDICVWRMSNPHRGIRMKEKRFFENKKISFVRVAWIHYIISTIMLVIFIGVGGLIYAKYSQCDPLQAKIVSRSDQVEENQWPWMEGDVFFCL